LLYYLTTFGCQVNYPIVAHDDGTLFFEDFENGLDNWTAEDLEPWIPDGCLQRYGRPFPAQTTPPIMA
jgi:hypothetical protein